jgi:Integrase core domain
VHDRSHTPHRLQTTLTPAQEAVAVVLRKTLLVSIDDLLAVVREFLNPGVSRSGLDRCLRRHGVGNLRDLQARDPRPKHKAFRAYAPGYLHVDVKYLSQMADESSRRYLFVAIDRATRWVFIRVFKSNTAWPRRNTPPTNGMVERFNGRIEEVLKSHHFKSGEELETTLDRYVLLYNQQLPQSALGSKTPLLAMKYWHKLKPELFRKQPYHLPGCDT